MNNENGVAFTQCYDVSGTGPHSGTISRSFTAPTTPGVYYITQKQSWEYNCYDNGSGNPGNNPNDAIAVVVVNVASNEITAVTTAGLSSPAGSYPITLQACSSYNPNYNVVLQNGTLEITDFPCSPVVHVWNADGNFNDATGSANGTPVGGVNAAGAPLLGSNSFSFDGSTGHIVAGTAASVSGTGYFSASAWIKTSSNDPMVVIIQRDATDFNGEYILKVGGSHFERIGDQDPAHIGKAYFIVFDFANNGATLDLFSTSLVNDGNWHHIRGERSGTTVNLYVDGVLEATTNTQGVVSLNGTLTTYIGADIRDNASYFNGLIDDVRVGICPDGETARINRRPVETFADKNKREDKLYPNPASSLLVLETIGDINPDSDIEVFDLVGKRAMLWFAKSGDGVYRANVSNLPKGMYVIKVKTGSGPKTYKFLKM
jgi:hypothetical protein